MAKIITNITQLTEEFISPEYSPYIAKQKAGIWQGTEAYKDMDMLVMRDVNFYQDVPEDIVILNNLIKPDQPWSEAHFQERIGGIPLNPGESYKSWPYAQFGENDPYLKGKQFDHSYMERFWPTHAGDRPHVGFPHTGIRFTLGDYNDVVQQLTDNLLTRQAYLPIFFPEDTGAKGSIRVPCTLGYLFEIQDNKLDITYYIRSCDIYRHFRNDVYMACRLLQHTKMLLFNNGNTELKTGRLIMKIANLHLFVNDQYPFSKRESKL